MVLLFCCAPFPGVATAFAERGLVWPTSEQPARVQRGSTLSLLVEVASGLTPPPGLQEERAHRSFAITLCATGIAFGAPADCCFPLRVDNVRPVDGASLRYRVEAPVPTWVAPGSYRLVARFPGGEAALEAGLRVASSASEPSSEQLRVHVGVRGLSTRSVPLQLYPLPASAGGFALGAVALVAKADAARLRLAAPPALTHRFAIAEVNAVSGTPTLLEALGAGPASRIFWWLGQGRGAEGARANVVLEARKAAQVQALQITREGALTLASRTIPIAPRYAFSCSVCRVGQQWSLGVLGKLMLAGLLAVVVSRKLRGRRWQPVRE